MATIDERFAALERRIALLEDQVAIYQLMAAYGPAADSGSTDRATSLWAEDGIYDLHSRVMTGRGEIAQELEGEWHQGLIAQGSGHIVSMPHVVVDGRSGRRDLSFAALPPRGRGLSGHQLQRQSLGVRARRAGLAGQAPDLTPARRIRGLARAAGGRHQRASDLVAAFETFVLCRRNGEEGFVAVQVLFGRRPLWRPPDAVPIIKQRRMTQVAI